MFDPETMGELMTELRQRAAGDRAAEQRVARLADELKRQPALEDDAKFRSRVAETVQGFERGGAAIPMTPELRASLAPEPQQQRQAAPQQTQTRAGAAVSAMSSLYAAMWPPAPATPPPWEQAQGSRMRSHWWNSLVRRAHQDCRTNLAATHRQMQIDYITARNLNLGLLMR